MNPMEDGSFDSTCNCIHLPYSDGASFAGFRDGTWPVPNSTEKLSFRGIKNLDGIIEFAMAHGMGKASELVVTGGSAGGLSTFLHTDRVAAAVKAVNPSVKARAAPVVGYFLVSVCVRACVRACAGMNGVLVCMWESHSDCT
jgi:hypothetical protein